VRVRLAVIPLILSAGLVACQEEDPSSPAHALSILERGCSEKDIGLILVNVDLQYSDDLGGPGRLEDDLRQLFVVYGELHLRHEDVVVEGNRVKSHLAVEGKGLRYEGPHSIVLVQKPSGMLIQSGVLEDLRGIVFVMRERRLALEKESPERLGQVVSMHYEGDVGGRRELLERVRHDLAEVDARALIIDDLHISVTEDEAKVIQSFLLITRAGGKKIENRDRERILLHREGTRWRITGGLG